MGSMLKSLLESNDDDTIQRRGQVEDFVNRYETGDPTEGFTDEEAVQRYDEVAGELSPEEYQEAAMRAFERMSPDQRREFAAMIAQHGDVSGMPIGPTFPNITQGRKARPSTPAKRASGQASSPLASTRTVDAARTGPFSPKANSLAESEVKISAGRQRSTLILFAPDRSGLAARL